MAVPALKGGGRKGGAAGSCLCALVVLKQAWRPSPTPPGPRAPRTPRASSELTERARLPRSLAGRLAPLRPPGSPPWGWRGGALHSWPRHPTGTETRRPARAAEKGGLCRGHPGRPAGQWEGRLGGAAWSALRGCACRGPAGKWAGQRAGAPSSPGSSHLCVRPLSLAQTPVGERSCQDSGAWLSLGKWPFREWTIWSQSPAPEVRGRRRVHRGRRGPEEKGAPSQSLLEPV